ncbi:response regulator [Candidatus Giovannonibacteria bacterium]|nr:response regulator [Candidatus Giovannonibacteria bacterium]
MKKVLIIEDEVPLLKILTQELSSKTTKTYGASNGKEGLAIAFREHPDLILLDLLMPEMDGITFLKKLREDKWGKGASVLILTNLEGDVEKTLTAIEKGVFEFLVKTRWSLRNLKKMVESKLYGKKPV